MSSECISFRPILYVIKEKPAITGPSNIPSTLEIAVAETYKFTVNTDMTDKYGNKITIPAGFTIVPHGTDNVEYNYDKNESGESTHIPTVQDGIVIKDEENYFVWVPVGSQIKNREGDIERGETSEIILGRYKFSSGGKTQLVQSSENYEAINDNTKINSSIQEFLIEEYNNSNRVAKNLEDFIIKTNEKGGYWLARYEAVKGEDGKVKAIPSTQEQTTGTSASDVTAGMVWTNITQPEASIKARTMYDEENDEFQSDLINSYSWDTAIVFIQTYSGDTDYSYQKSLNTYLDKTGERDETTTDKRCNIYDMASNVKEWSTETGGSVSSISYCTIRGGNVESKLGNYTYGRSTRDVSVFENKISFRPILYLLK